MDVVRVGSSAGSDAFADREGHASPSGSQPLIEREHHVVALLVAHQGSAWLPRTVASLAAQDRPADHVVAIDAGSTDGSGGILRQALPGVLTMEAIGVDAAYDAAGFGRALARAAASATARTSVTPTTGQGDVVRWYWILHDDSAPDPDALAQLLAAADRNRHADVLIPKTVAWSDHGRLVGIGNRWAPGSPVVERLEPRERDQGQYDVDRPVYTGDSAGMLVRSDAWQAHGGFEPALGAWAAPTGLCRRVWGSGASVVFVPQAVLAHRRAGHQGARAEAPGAPAPRRRDREAMLLLELSRGSAWTLPLRYARAWVATLLRSIALLVTHESRQARAKIQGSWDVLGHPARIRAARRTLRAAKLPESTRPPHVRTNRGTVTHNLLDDLLAGQRARRRAGSESWRPSPRVWRPLAFAGVLALLALVRSPSTLFGAGTLRGGGLLPAPGSTELLAGYLASWHDVGLGTSAPLPPYLAILGVLAVPLLGSVDVLLRLCFALAVPLAFLSAYVSIGPTRLGPWRTIVALTWALLPAGVAAAGDGRISTLAVLLLGPPTARAYLRALGAARSGASIVHPVLVASALAGLLAAFAPAAFLLLTVGAVLAWLCARCPLWAVRAGGLPLLAGLGFLILWLPRVVAAPWLLLADLGRTDPSLTDPAAQVLGLSPGGPGALVWPGVPLLVVAVAAGLWHSQRRAPLLTVCAAGAGLAAVAWAPSVASGLWSGQVAQRVWLGQPLLLLSALLLGALGALVNRPGRSNGLSGTGLVLALVALFAGWWLAPVQVATSQATGEPPVVTLAAQTPDRPRAIVLSRSAGQVAYGVATSGPARLGDADALADQLDGQGLTHVVQGLVSGAGVDVITELGGRAVRYVVFDGPPEDPLVAELDATSGLRRLATSAEQSLWLVSGDPVRAELGPAPAPDGAASASGSSRVVVPVETTPSSVEVVLHPLIALPRTLLLAEMDDPGWQVLVNGDEVSTHRDVRGMATAEVTAAGLLSVHHRSPWPWLAGGHLVGVVVLLLAAVPWRRSESQREALG